MLIKLWLAGSLNPVRFHAGHYGFRVTFLTLRWRLISASLSSHLPSQTILYLLGGLSNSTEVACRVTQYVIGPGKCIRSTSVVNLSKPSS